jgi:hypothetical protein
MIHNVTATRYGLESPRIKSRWGKIFRVRQDRPWGPPNLLYKGHRLSSPEVKWPGGGVEHPPQLAPNLKDEWRYTSAPLLGLHGPLTLPFI